MRGLRQKRKMTTAHRPHELIEHTADLGLRVFAHSAEELFINAAKGMFAVIAERKVCRKKSAGTKKTKFELDISARNREELLVSWLSELLTLFDIHDIIFICFKITQLTAKQIKALAWGEPLNKQTYIRKTEIKAVTYHRLNIKKVAGELAAEIFFDT